MATRDMWKLLYRLHVYGPSLTRDAVRSAGIQCDGDTLWPLIIGGLLESLPPSVPFYEANEYRLTSAANAALQLFLVTSKEDIRVDTRVDEPRVFVIMPFGEPWSQLVYADLIEKAVMGAGLNCVRGDAVVRTGNLQANITSELLLAGAAIVDASALNANVFYELGLCHALGKEAFLLKQRGIALPADLAGAHYLEYSVDTLAADRAALQGMLQMWATSRFVRVDH